MIETDDRIPSIVLAVPNGSSQVGDLNELFNGIEEEEIPVSIAQINAGDSVANAYQAALQSKLSVGLAFDDQQIVLHFKNLDEQTPLFRVSRRNPKAIRALGANAARLVKGTPFKIDEGSEIE